MGAASRLGSGVSGHADETGAALDLERISGRSSVGMETRGYPGPALSSGSMAMTGAAGSQPSPGGTEKGETPTSPAPEGAGGMESEEEGGPNELSEKEKREVEDLKRTDREVRAHERAHMAAGGRYVRGKAQYRYEVGPDGQRYAVAGEVRIDVSKVPDDPGATVEKAGAVKRAALAPKNPSGRDRQVAAAASRMEMEARREMMAERAEERQGGESDSDGPTTPAGAEGVLGQGMELFGGGIDKKLSEGIVEGPVVSLEEKGASDLNETDAPNLFGRERGSSDAGISTADRGWTGALLRDNETERDDAIVGGRQEADEASTRMNAWQALGAYGEMQASEKVIDTYG